MDFFDSNLMVKYFL